MARLNTGPPNTNAAEQEQKTGLKASPQRAWTKTPVKATKTDEATTKNSQNERRCVGAGKKAFHRNQELHAKVTM